MLTSLLAAHRDKTEASALECVTFEIMRWRRFGRHVALQEQSIRTGASREFPNKDKRGMERQRTKRDAAPR